jgi:hypothetical protein
MAADLLRIPFRAAHKPTTMIFVVALTRRRYPPEWSGEVEIVDLDVAGPQPEAVRRAVRALRPQMMERLKTDAPNRPRAGKARYCFRLDADGRTVEPTELTKNTAMPHHLAMGIRKLVAESRFPKAPGARWCRFSLALLPAEPRR